MTSLFLLAKLVTTVWVAYRISSGSPFSLRGAATYALAVGGALAFFGGFSLAVQEDARARYGRVAPGVVVEKFSSTGMDGSRRIGPSGGRDQARTRPVVTGKGFAFYETFTRLMVTGSSSAWVIDYRFPCDAASVCRGRDFVTEEQWWRLREGQAVNVRQAEGETGTSRLDDNPQWETAFADLGIAGMLLLAAGLVSGRVALFPSRAWITAPAVVTAVQRVTYRDVVRWRVRFAYFDSEGAPQESADEVVSEGWKPGDQCLAVFRTTRPDLATMRPLAEGLHGSPVQNAV